MIKGLEASIMGLTGWRRYLLALGLGVVAVGALAPIYMIVLFVPAFTGLVWLIFSGSGWRSAAAAGWWFGLGYFIAGLYWIGNALLVDAERFGFMAPFAVLGLAAALAFFTALAAGLAWRFGRDASGVGRVLVFAAAWVLVEWLRGWVFTGFPWNLVGSAWAGFDAMVQGASIAGVYGLSLLTVVVAAMPSTLGGCRRPTVIACTILAVVWAGGMLRLSAAPAIGTDMVAGVGLRLVQPNIDQKLKWRQNQRPKNIEEQARLSRTPSDQPPTHIFWAETAATYFIARDRASRLAVAAAAPRGGLVITGAPRTTPEAENIYRIWNSLHVVDGAGAIVGTYDKHHLVPFGEYLPLRNILGRIFGLSKITAGTSDFSPGPGPQTLRLKGLPPVSPLICYEIIFPGAVLDARDRPEWLLNLTNDGWYGNSSGPYQHFDAARLRAVEEGLPVVRVANTGISGVIDGYGRTVARLALGEKGIVDSGLPRPLAAMTVYARTGNWLAVLLALMMGALGALLWRVRQ